MSEGMVGFVTGLMIVMGGLLLLAICAALLGAASGYMFDRFEREVDQKAYERYQRRVSELARYCYPHEAALKNLFIELGGDGGYKEPWDVLKTYRKEMKRDQ